MRPTCSPFCWTARATSGYGQSIAVRYGRVKLAEQIAELLQPELVIFLVGERPGGDAAASRSLSAYLVYRLDGPAQAEAAQFSGNPAIRFGVHGDFKHLCGRFTPGRSGGRDTRKSPADPLEARGR